MGYMADGQQGWKRMAVAGGARRRTRIRHIMLRRPCNRTSEPADGQDAASNREQRREYNRPPNMLRAPQR